ncbi:cyclic 3',5'-adenosine monophosphate phosphodiesterase [Pirellulimonas nuda]|uniref:Cyclic 3',5'-adenosine monophosphate phosphodiesterase n=1 Tax=Pirellulimonas nuda TaxID=2528009 RepID=A0A518DHQ5_9BACT|nr:metallophosphoesterase family protein [Pirellulimonas nuda]QDU91008.1 cyclic 3',5'-adenosine monophosphate phosphodiesterase [Pirellulimonas nuda]
MLNLLQISDLHFGPPYVPGVGDALLKQAQQLPIDAIVVNGDLTQRATAEQFEQAKAFIDALPEVPYVVIPGNHDVPLYRVWERLTDPYREYQKHISTELNQVLRVHAGDQGACIVALNSAAPRRAITNGRVDPWQLELCGREFDQTPAGELRIVVVHHHFAPPPDYDRSPVMPGARRALDYFQAHDVDLLLGGHLHRAYIGNSLDIYAGGEREHGIIVAQCGTTTSRRGRAREREKNSFNYIQADEHTLTVTHWMFFTDEGRFAPVGRHMFPRRPHHRLPEASADESEAALTEAPNRRDGG